MDFNINFNTDDSIINDYLYCWSVFNTRPNKLNLYNNYNSVEFLELLGSIEYQGIVTDVIPTNNDYIINEKSLVKISSDIFISYNHCDKLVNDGFIDNVIIYYNNVDIQELLYKLDEVILLIDDNVNKYNSISINQEGLCIEVQTLLKYDDNISLYFNDDVIKHTDKIIKSIKKHNKGLHIIHGERGTGKTTLSNYIISKLDKMVLYIPSNLIEHTINNPDFVNFIKTYKDSIIIIDDCEIYNKSNFSTNLLQLVDGLLSDSLSLNIICILNELEDSIDDILLECNNLNSIIEVGSLKRDKCNELSKYLGHKKIKHDSEYKLVDIIKKRWDNYITSEIGFD